MVLALYSHDSLLDDFGRVRRASLAATPKSRLTYNSYLILPGLYARDEYLKFSQAVLSVFVVALLTAGYSFTALLCFACRDDEFQAENVFVYVTLAKQRARN
jgi:hypothetical protein